jgi:hypothetical protein
MNMQDQEMPAEVLEAKKAYDAEFDKIRDKVLANREKYKGTKYEDCPPMLREHMRFGVRQYVLARERKRLKEEYGECPFHWAYYVAWWKGKRREIESQGEA